MYRLDSYRHGRISSRTTYLGQRLAEVLLLARRDMLSQHLTDGKLIELATGKVVWNSASAPKGLPV